jgi:hypothetical protein
VVVLRNLPPPIQDPIAKQPRPQYKGGIDPQAGLMTDAWIDFQTAQSNQLNSVPVKAASVSLTDQTTAIAATDMTEGSINGGQYRLSWWIGVTNPNAGSSSLEVDFDWEYRGVSRIMAGTALVLNSTAEYDSQVRFISVDGNSPVRYTVTYTTGLGAPMAYDLFICLESVPL